MASLENLLKEFLYDYAKGKDSSVKASELRELFGCSAREIRHAVNRLRCKGVPIGSGSCGYYYCATREELEETLAVLRSYSEALKEVMDGLNQSFSSFQ